MEYVIARFVHVKSTITDMILFQSSGGQYSHVELVTDDGKYIGAHVAGVEARPMDYDAGTFERELFMLLPMRAEAAAKCLHYMRAVADKHEGYNLLSILGFTTHFDLTKPGTTICSALVLLALRWCEYFPRPFTIPAHRLSVRDLFIVLMGRPDMEVIEKTDPRFTAYVSAGA